MANDKKQYTSDDLASFGDVLETGKYTTKLTKIETKDSKDETKGSYVTLEVEFLDGEKNEGLTGVIFLFPKVSEGKDGKLYARGLQEAKAICAAWGAPLPSFSLSEFNPKVTPKGAALLQKLIFDSYKKAGQPRLITHVVEQRVQEKNDASGKYEDAHNDDGSPKMRRVCVIKGRADAASTSEPSLTTAAAPPENGAPEDDAKTGEALSFV